MSAKPLVTAAQVYAIMRPYTLTDEQASAVQDASTEAPTLVVAGAGSGKTELMAVRVLWLVANSVCRPEEILGLTFTRKAAAELSKRIYEALLKLRDSDLWPVDLDYDFTQPTISTYNAYSNGLFRDFALSIGYEPEATLLTDAAAFQLAREVVVRYGSEVDSRLSDLDLNLDDLVSSVIELAQAMNDNLANSEQVEAVLQTVVEDLSQLPRKIGSNDTTPFAYLTDILEPLIKTSTIAKLADRYREEKHKRSYVDYSDQVALAELAVRTVPALKTRERSGFKQVLLDEYQDTSFLQTRLLQGLFEGHPVYAVGDPNQSIYGWRGASASNLDTFGTDFGKGFIAGVTESKSAANVKQFSLSTSWRNPRNVLTVANHLALPLTLAPSYLPAQTKSEGKLELVTLKSRQNADEGLVNVEVLENSILEADRVAEWFASKPNDSTLALLMRWRGQMPLYVERLENAGLAVEVVGLGGLMQMPEIVDLVSALKVIHLPTAGSQLIRLLTGPRWRIAAKDIERLHKFAAKNARYANQPRPKNSEGSDAAQEYAIEDATSLVDALDLLLEDRHASRTNLSQKGLARMKDAARTLQAMRQKTGMGLAEFVRAVQEELWLDIEVTANPRRKNPMAHLNAFSNVVANYAASNNNPTLASFLAWLDYADQREKFEVPNVTPEKGVVQLLTVHAAKGLEWDYVAVANLAANDFPNERTQRGDFSGWLEAGKLPYPLRGDNGSLPSFDYSKALTQKDASDAKANFKDLVKDHILLEERRLAYVAVTRPKLELFLTGSYWKPGTKKIGAPSQYLYELATLPSTVVQVANRTDDIDEPFAPSESLENQLLETSVNEQWPLDPLGDAHRASLQTAKLQTLTALEAARINPELLVAENELHDQIDLLLREREQSLIDIKLVDAPVRVSASAFKDFVTRLPAIAEHYRRPMPTAPYKQTRAGTLFHAWVEQRFGLVSLPEPEEPNIYGDSVPTEEIDQLAEFGSQTETIEALKATFEKSRWANQIPLEIEREIQLTIANNTFVCKLDAVFKTDTGFEIVDWKTGKPPTTDAEVVERSLQLALYRLAYSRFTGVPESQIEVSLYFVNEALELRPSQVPAGDELLAIWRSVLEQFVV
jgi:DNA helicase-2/ATP-dependent DNA helicase PcrA